MTADRYARDAHALTRRCPDRTIVHAEDQLHELIGPSVHIWDLLVQPMTVDELLASLAERYDSVPADSVTQTLRDMDDRGMTRRVAPA